MKDLQMMMIRAVVGGRVEELVERYGKDDSQNERIAKSTREETTDFAWNAELLKLMSSRRKGIWAFRKGGVIDSGLALTGKL